MGMATSSPSTGEFFLTVHFPNILEECIGQVSRMSGVLVKILDFPIYFKNIANLNMLKITVGFLVGT